MEVKSRNRGIIALLVIASLVLGISGFLLLVNSSEEPLTGADVGELSQATNAIEPDNEAEITTTDLPTIEPTTEGISSTETSERVEPTARVGLQGTDPETVNLASGDIQLIEFFAFW